MKSMSAVARGFLLVTLSLLGALAGCENQPSYLTYLSTVTGATESVLVPDHAVVSSAELSAAAGPSGSPTPEPSGSPTASALPEPVSTLTVTMAAPRPADLADPLVVVSYLRNDAGENRAIVLGVRTAAPFSNWLPDGYGALLDPQSRTILEIQPLTVAGTEVSVTFSPWLLAGYSMEYARSHWLPSTVPAESVVGGLAGADSSLTGYDVDSMAQVDLPDVDCSSFVSSGALAAPRSANASCPPRRRDNVTDIDLDGRPNTKHDREVIYNDSVTPLGNGKLYVVLGIIRPNQDTGRADGASSCFVPCIVDDTDGDGKADPEEVKDKTKRKAIGQCVYGRGSNTVSRNGNIITWTSTDMDSRGRPTGHQTRFEYNLDTGKLKTFVTDPNGTEQFPNPSFPI